MSRLLQKMNDYVTVNGMSGKARLCEATNRNMRSVERWLTGDFNPSTQTKYQLALACGCTKKEALALASEEPEARDIKAS